MVHKHSVACFNLKINLSTPPTPTPTSFPLQELVHGFCHSLTSMRKELKKRGTEILVEFQSYEGQHSNTDKLFTPWLCMFFLWCCTHTGRPTLQLRTTEIVLETLWFLLTVGLTAATFNDKLSMKPYHASIIHTAIEKRTHLFPVSLSWATFIIQLFHRADSHSNQ